MSLQAPPRPAVSKDDADAGVIEDARRRQRRHRIIGMLLFLFVGIGSIAGFGGGGSGGRGGSGGHGSGPKPPGPEGGALHPAGAGLAGAPMSQSASVAGVSSWQCPIAPANRYLPARAGCVSVMRADMTGDGRADLVIVYSRLNHRSAAYPGAPAQWRHYFGASDATLEVVLPGGREIATRLTTTYRGRTDPIHVATIIAAKHVSDHPGAEIFLEIGQISSGSTAAAYGLESGRLAPAGVLLAYGGDSTSQAGFNCRTTTNPPELIQRVFAFGARGTRARWQETQITYVWHGLRLRKVEEDTSGRSGNLPIGDIEVGRGCGPPAWVNRGASAYMKLLQ